MNFDFNVSSVDNQSAIEFYRETTVLMLKSVNNHVNRKSITSARLIILKRRSSIRVPLIFRELLKYEIIMCRIIGLSIKAWISNGRTTTYCRNNNYSNITTTNSTRS